MAQESLNQKSKSVNSERKTLKAALYLIPVTLGETPLSKVLPSYNLEVIKNIKDFIVENTKSARRFLAQVDSSLPIETFNFVELNEHTDLKTIGNYLQPIEKFKRPVGVISEAGCPAVADPGAAVVEMAQRKSIPVIPLVGPSSMIMAVMASGFNGQSFSFNGYLPVKQNERAAKIRQLENRSYKENQTQLFIEAPYRNAKMFETILQTCSGETKLCIACGITTDKEYIRTHTIAEWKKLPVPEINKIPAIFLIYKN